MLEIGIMNKNNISKLSEILEKEKSVEFKYNYNTPRKLNNFL